MKTKALHIISLFSLVFLFLGQRAVAQTYTVEVTPNQSEFDLGSATVGTYSSPKNITFKVTPIEWDHVVNFEGSDKDDFYLAKRPYFDFGSGEAQVSIMFAPKSAGAKEAYFVVKYVDQELRRIKVTGLGVAASAPEIITDYARLEFGEVSVGKNKEIKLTVSTKNSGSSIGCKVRGTHASEFSVSGTIAPNQNDQQIGIVFTPTTAGEKSAELVLTDGVVEKLVTITASGKAQSDPVTVTPNVRELDFGSTTVGQYSAVQTISFKADPMDFNYSFSFEGDQINDFYQYKRPFFDYDGTATAMFMFAPKSAGAKEAYLVLKLGSEEVLRITVKGVGVSAASPEITTDLSLLEFGEVLLGQQKSVELHVTSKNSTSSITTEIEGRHAGEFKIKGSVSPNMASQPLSVTFTPTTEGQKEAFLVIKDGEVIKRISLNASAKKPEIKITPSVETLTFADTYVGEKSAEQSVTFTFANVTEAFSISIDGTHKGDFSYKGSLDPTKATGTLTLTYAPQAAGKSDATLSVTSGGKTAIVRLAGTAYEKKTPEIVVTPNAFDFGRVQINTYLTKEVTVEVRHTSAIPTLQLEGAGKDIFNIVSTAKAGTFQLKLGALPNKKGIHEASLQIRVDQVEVSVPIRLECWAPEAVLESDVKSIVFPKTPIMSSASQKSVNLTLRNLSEDVRVTILGANATEFRATKEVLSRVSETHYLGVTFVPTTMGAKQAILRLTAEDKQIEIALSGEAVEGVGVAEVSATHGWSIAVEGGLLTIQTLQQGQQLSIFTASGEWVYSQPVNDAKVSVALEKGVYLVRYANETVKVIIQ